MKHENFNDKSKKKESVKQTEKDRAQHYDIDGVSMDDTDDVVVGSEKKKKERQ